MDVWRCLDEQETREAVAWAAAESTPLRLLAGRSKANLGRPVSARLTLDLAPLAGITLYEPEELVLRARAATPIAVIEARLAEHGQRLAFEPRDLGPLLGGAQGKGTVGGLVSTNLAGPRRFRAGAARDHVLGVTAVSGRGEIFKSGGRVMKNVTGYDLPKLLTGAYGTLGILTEITLRVAPIPEDERTIVLIGLDDRSALQSLGAALQTPYDITGAAHLPEAVARVSHVSPIAALHASVTLLRLEGLSVALAVQIERLLETLRRPEFLAGPLSHRGGPLVLEQAQSQALWAEIRDVRYFAGTPGPVWRVSTVARHGAEVAASIGAEQWFYDWAGGLLWLRMEESPHADEGVARRALAHVGGHATLVRADADVRGRVSVFEPQPAALAALTRRVKNAFDPACILNPGLMYAEI